MASSEPSKARCLKVVVAGTGFGRVYLDALTIAPGEFELTGILAKGSGFSARIADSHQVPLFSRADDIPDDTDILCVVVRSGATGGPGSDIARCVLARGIHVLQEHPVHAQEISTNLQAARKGNAAYLVNTLYPNLRPVQQFLAAAAWLRTRHQPRFIDAACNSQVAYPLLDMLGQAVGSVRPWTFRLHAGTEELPFSSLSGHIANIPLTLRVQNQVAPHDPDNHGLLMHRMEIGFDSGVLSLEDTNGPVYWNARMHAPRNEAGRLHMRGPGTERLAVTPMTRLDSDELPSYHEVFASLWPDAVMSALRDLRAAIADPAQRMRHGLWSQSVSLAWRDLTTQLGMPKLIHPGVPPEVNPAELIRASRAAREKYCGA